MANNKKLFLIFFGPPGCGKGTQSDMLGAKLKLPVISPGELLRAEEEKGSALGRAVADKLANGKLVNTEIIERILGKRLADKDTKRGFILDGFPRSLGQFKWLQAKAENILHPGDKVIAIFIDCSDKEVKRRITGRRVCECGASYHLVYNPPKKKDRCDLCGKKLQMREDDKPKVVNDRLKLFHRKMRPLARAFEKYYELIVVDGDKDIGRVKDQIAKKLEKLV